MPNLRVWSHEFKPVIRESLAVQAALRSLGYPEQTMSMVFDTGGVYVLLEAIEGSNLAIQVGEIDPWEINKFQTEWDKATAAWNEGRIVDKHFLLKSSHVQSNWESFLKLLKDAKVPVPGPELMN